jgi:hypothetical protein
MVKYADEDNTPQSGGLKSIDELIIYESPDGGKTVYGRRLGEDPEVRVILKQDGKSPYIDALDYMHACDIANENELIKDALERLAVIYALCEKENE